MQHCHSLFARFCGIFFWMFFVFIQNSVRSLQRMEGRFLGHQTVLHQAAVLGNSEAIAALIQAGCALDLQNRDGNTALHEVSWHGFLKCVKLLIKAGANLHIKNKAGNTALHLASQNDHFPTARLLLLGGATPDTTNSKGETALHVAATLSHKRTVKLLLDFGANAYIRNHEGQMALDIAKENDHRRVVLLLSKYSQQKSLSFAMEMHSSEPRDSTQEKQLQSHFTLAAIKSSKGKRFKDQQSRLKDPIVRDNSWTHYRNTFQLYSLYRDADGNIRQEPAKGCPCGPKIKKLEERLKDIEKELRLHMLTMHEQFDSRLCKMDHKSKHQKEMNHNLKRWRTTKIPIAVESLHYNLLPASPAEPSDPGLESTPLLSMVSADSSTSVATYVNILPPKSIFIEDKKEWTRSEKYFEMKKNGSPGDNQHKALSSLCNCHGFGFLLDSNNFCCQTPRVRDGNIAVAMCDQSFSNSSSNQCDMNDQDPLKRILTCKSGSNQIPSQIQVDDTRTLESFVDPQSEATLFQERNHLHAMEVTQQFFETVSIQLERWYERKILEVEKQTKLKMQQERQELLQHINKLEEELQKLKTDEKPEL
ncbi:ankyrin repeat domain-containing protein 6 [Corythoichthys intestinalis]|uniref:ankyrin repeat domain-containing protein 6 n=1 Tax=Corythoichthys intestinalis TaxID=161448 RepID=UPI0025A4DF4D|nr:ankyrin repeat domain-containing protein 6 [Corythoichthys intestinalis]